MKMVRIQRVYEEVLAAMELPEKYYDSKLRLLRIKGKFLLENIMGRTVDSLKNSGKIEVPEAEAPIIKNILIEALDAESMVSDWFAGKVDLSDPTQVILLFWQLKEPIMRPLMQGKTDEVTTDEWLASVDAVIDFSNAEKVSQMKRNLDDLRMESLPLDSHIGVGDVVVEDENGNRRYAMRGRRDNPAVLELVSKLAEQLNSEDDYIDAVNLILARFISDAKKKSEEVVSTLAEYYALCESLNEENEASNNDIENEDVKEDIDEFIASEYVQRDRKVYRYLRAKPDFAATLNSRLNVGDVARFFRAKEE